MWNAEQSAETCLEPNGIILFVSQRKDLKPRLFETRSSNYMIVVAYTYLTMSNPLLTVLLCSGQLVWTAL